MDEAMIQKASADLAGLEYVGVMDIQRKYGLGYYEANEIVLELVKRGRLLRVFNSARPWKVCEVKEAAK